MKPVVVQIKAIEAFELLEAWGITALAVTPERIIGNANHIELRAQLNDRVALSVKCWADAGIAYELELTTTQHATPTLPCSPIPHTWTADELRRFLVNNVEYATVLPQLEYDDLAALGGWPKMSPSIVYSRGPDNSTGIVGPGDLVDLVDRMVFNVAVTGNA